MCLLSLYGKTIYVKNVTINCPTIPNKSFVVRGGRTSSQLFQCHFYYNHFAAVGCSAQFRSLLCDFGSLVRHRNYFPTYTQLY